MNPRDNSPDYLTQEQAIEYVQQKLQVGRAYFRKHILPRMRIGVVYLVNKKVVRNGIAIPHRRFMRISARKLEEEVRNFLMERLDETQRQY